MAKALRFREIDIDQDADLCIQFRADSFVESFGSADRFFEAAGEGGKDYLAGLRGKTVIGPGAVSTRG